MRTPVTVAKHRTPTGRETWVLFDPQQGVFYGRQRVTRAEAQAAADKENERLARLDAIREATVQRK